MERLDKITQYIDGTLSETDKTAFESEIKADDNLAKEVAFHFIAAQAAKEAALRKRKEAFLENLRNNPIPEEPSSTSPKSSAFKWLAGLAAILLCVVGYFYGGGSPPKPKQTPQQLFAAYFSHKDIETNMGSSDTSEYQRCEEAYKNKNIPLAIERLLAYRAKDVNNTAVIKLLVKCYMEQSQWNEAEQVLTSAENIPSFLADIRWYRAGIALGRGDAAEARNRLNEVIKANDGRAKDAKAILEEL